MLAETKKLELPTHKTNIMQYAQTCVMNHIMRDKYQYLNAMHNELSQRLVRYCSVEDATLEGAVCCR